MQQRRRVFCVNDLIEFQQNRMQSFERSHSTTGHRHTYANDVRNSHSHIDARLNEHTKQNTQLFGQEVATPNRYKNVRNGHMNRTERIEYDAGIDEID